MPSLREGLIFNILRQIYRTYPRAAGTFPQSVFFAQQVRVIQVRCCRGGMPMSMIKVEDLSFSYPGSYDDIFENVNFTIDTDWRLGFVGRNGRGKTTFLRLLMGMYEYSGKIISSVSFDYFPYPVKDRSVYTEEIINEICPEAEQWEIVRELSYLKVSDEVLWRPFETLSNGEQTKVMLAALFLNEGHFLLIDEPTNHLDTLGRELLASYLSKKKGFILVSHDRHFLDGCVDHILSINRMNIEIQSGNFSTWFEGFQKRQEAEAAKDKRLRSDISRLKSSARRTAEWSDKVEASKVGAGDKGYVGHMAAKMMKRSKSIEQRKEKAIEEKSKLLRNVETAEELSLSPLQYHKDLLLSLSGVSVCYDGRTVCGPVTFSVHRGDRLILDGKNGSGKSSLLKLMTGAPIEHTGELSLGSGLIISYVPQDTSFLQGSIPELEQSQGLDAPLFRAILRKLGFERVMFEKDMKDYSEGQKKKVLLAKSLCEKAHLYIWDEPLNFIDIYSRMQIEQLILECCPTMVLVEHDRAFRDRVGTSFVVL